MTNKGTIIYVGGFELPDKNAAAQRVVSNAKLLRDIGYHVVLLDSCRGQAFEMEKKPDCFGFFRWSVKKSNKQLYSIDPVVRVIEQYTDVVAVIGYNYPAIALGKLRRYCIKKGVRLIADVTEWYGAQGNTIVHKAVKGLDSYCRMNILQPRLDGIIAISHYLEDYYKNKTETIFLPPLVDLAEEKWNQQALEDGGERLLILYAGSPGRDKDKLNLILRALHKCDSARYLFRIIGITQEQYLTYYPEDAALLQEMAGSVVFLGRRAHAEVIRELKAADFSLFYRESTRVTMAGFPTKYAESISAGTSVLTNQTSDLADYMIEGVNGFWINDIERDLPRIIQTDDLRGMKSKLNRNTFDYRNYIDRMEKWMTEVLQ